MSKQIDTIGMLCPMPLIKTKEELANMQSGQELTVNFDCIQATEAIPRFIAENGHQVSNYEQIEDGVYTITLKKK